MPANPIYKFHAELMNIDLKVWREFEVVNNYSMSKFGYIIMSLFNMRGHHLFQFIQENKSEPPKENYIEVLKEFAKNNVKTKQRKQFLEYAKESFNPESDEFVRGMFENRHKRYFYEVPNPYNDGFNPYQIVYDATKTKLSKVMTDVGENIIFNYDFGDNWEIKLTLKEIYTDNNTHGREFPRVLNGEGCGIIEDCGGVGGLEDLIEAFELKSGEEYEEYSQWLGKIDIDFKSFDKRYFAMLAKRANAIFKDAYENIED